MRFDSHMTNLVGALLCASLLLPACQKKGQTEDETATTESEVAATSEQEGSSTSGSAAEELPDEPADRAEEQEMSDSYAADALESFSLQLAGKLFADSESPENTVVSPWSINSALALVAAGANNDTWLQMISTLGYGNASPDRQEEIIRGIADLNDDILPGPDSSITLTSANRAWIEESIRSDLVDHYEQLLQEAMNAALGGADFRNNPETARQSINEWVAEHTNDKIQDLLPPNSIERNTNLVITNAVYFLADWASQFNAELTEDKSFYLQSGEEVQVPMMRKNFPHMLHWETEDFEAVAIPYKDRDFAMVIYLPENTSYDQFEQMMVDDRGDVLLPESAQTGRVILEVPRAEIRWSHTLQEVLSALGMEIPFTGSADFTRMFETENVAISEVYHEAYMKIDEQGTEAAAATGAVVSRTSMPTDPPLRITIDRPYYVMVAHTAEWTPLFLAKINDPRTEDERTGSSSDDE
jgi:serpin B